MRPILEPDQARELASAAVQCSAADETEVTVDERYERFARFSAQGPTQDAERGKLTVSVRVRVRDGSAVREARASVGSDDAGAIARTTERAIALARISPPREAVPELGGKVQVPETTLARPTIDHDFREKAEWIEPALSACHDVDLAPAGLGVTTGLQTTLVNSSGRDVSARRSRASLSLTATGPDGAGMGFQIAKDADDIDAEGVVARAVQKASAGRDPQILGPGEYTVVLEPAAISSLLLFGAYHGFGAQDVHEESSFLCGRIGEQLFPEQLDLVDDVENEVYPGIPFDGEGSPRRRVPLLSGGALRGPVTSAHWARQLGCENTGHGQPQPSAHGPAPENMVLAAGDSSLEELIEGVERGLLVTQFHYTNMIEPRDLSLTGMTRNGTFLIENGEVKHAVRNLRFTDSLVSILQAVDAVGTRREVAGALFDGEVLCPAVRTSVRFTSTSPF